ncbi:MAG: aminoglycoside phosphotransferase family protein [bacterium]
MINPQEQEKGALEAAPLSELEAFRRSRHEQWNTPAETIESLVLRATGSALNTQRRIIGGETNEVYEAVTDSGQEVIVRISHGKRNRFEKEQWALQQCAKVGVPAPEMLLVDSLSVGGKNVYVCVETKLPGVGLDTVPVSERTGILRELGELLGRLHSIKTEGFGILDSEGRGKFTSVPELVIGDHQVHFRKIINALEGRTEDISCLQEASAILEKEAQSHVKDAPCLVHNDLCPQHVLVHNGKISGIIDFESAQGADASVDFGRWEIRYGKDYPLNSIEEGYDQRNAHFWKMYRTFGSLRYCVEHKKETGITAAIQAIRESAEFLARK